MNLGLNLLDLNIRYQNLILLEYRAGMSGSSPPLQSLNVGVSDGPGVPVFAAALLAKYAVVVVVEILS